MHEKHDMAKLYIIRFDRLISHCKICQKHAERLGNLFTTTPEDNLGKILSVTSTTGPWVKQPTGRMRVRRGDILYDLLHNFFLESSLTVVMI